MDYLYYCVEENNWIFSELDPLENAKQIDIKNQNYPSAIQHLYRLREIECLETYIAIWYCCDIKSMWSFL